MRAYKSLRGRGEFTLVMRRGKMASARSLAVYRFAPRTAAPDGVPKVGVIVTKRVGKAVVRNRLRRRCKAILDAAGLRRDAGWYAIVCKPEAATLGFAELKEQLTEAVARSRRPKRPSRGAA